MKIELFNDLVSLFQQQLSNTELSHMIDATVPELVSENTDKDNETNQPVLVFKEANALSTRVFTSEERFRLTKASQQFLVRLATMNIFATDYLEMVINRLLLSDSRVISLNETKWFLREFIQDELTEHQLAFLDLVLYQNKDQISIH